MSDVFISYSRLDKAFVSKLREALASQDQNVWIDWESIPPSQVWWNEIRNGIAKANNFVVILSPNSMASPICHMEIEYARQLGKRIIPVVYKDFNREDAITEIARKLANPEHDVIRQLWANRQPHVLFDTNDNELKLVHYFFFQPDDSFEVRFNELLIVIRTDFHYKDQHTKLELRAREWSSRERDVSFLLLDTELAGAEDWLRSAQSKEPPPTKLQIEYIQASKKRNRRLRIIRLSSLVSLVVALFSTLFAVGASVVATQTVNEITEANANATMLAIDIAKSEAYIESLRLAAEAGTILNDLDADPENAALLAIRALNTAYSPEADTALVRAITRLETRHIFDGNRDGDTAVAFSPDGHFALTGSGDGVARLWSLETGEELRSFTGHTNTIWSVAFSPDGTRILTGGFDNTARLWDVSTGEELHVLAGHTAMIWSVAFSPLNTQVLTGSADGTARLWNVRTGREIHRFTEQFNVTSVAFSPNGKQIITGSGDSTAILWEVESGEELHRFVGHTSGIWAVGFTPDGNNIVTGSYDYTARLWNINSQETIRVFSGHRTGIISIDITADGKYLVTAGEDSMVKVWNLETGETIRQITYQSSSIKFSPNGKYVLIGGDTAKLWHTHYKDFVDYACTLVTSDLEEGERRFKGIFDNIPTCPKFGSS